MPSAKVRANPVPPNHLFRSFSGSEPPELHHQPPTSTRSGCSSSEGTATIGPRRRGQALQSNRLRVCGRSCPSHGVIFNQRGLIDPEQLL